MSILKDTINSTMDFLVSAGSREFLEIFLQSRDVRVKLYKTPEIMNQVLRKEQINPKVRYINILLK